MTLKLYLLVGVYLFTLSIRDAFGQICLTNFDTTAQTFYYPHPEKMANYEGGMDSIRSVLSHHLRFSSRDCFEGTVFLSFIIDSDGQMSHPQVLKGVWKPIDEEALRVVQFLNHWIPGECQGKKVPTKFVLPIRFYSPF